MASNVDLVLRLPIATFEIPLPNKDGPKSVSRIFKLRYL